MSQKIAISSEGPSLDDMLDSRFGRAAGFVVVDPDTMESTYLNNASAQMRGQGAGIQAAEMVAGSGAKLVLTGYVGPKAFQALQAAGIQVGQELQGLTVRQALERYQAGQVQAAQAPNSAGRP
jgi:predicted Fe-Mo cluster-binding NifX family protein